MSDAFVRSIENLGLTIVGKLNDAERASEYYNGIDRLRRGVADFHQTLLNDPDYRSYGEKAAQARAQLWQQVDQTTKHPGAKNDLQVAWLQMQAQDDAAIQDISNGVRIKTLHADLIKRIDQRSKDVERGAMNAAQAAQLNHDDIYSQSQGPSPVIDPTQGYNVLQQQTYNDQLSEVYRKTSVRARDGGWDAAISEIPQTVAGYSELTATDIPQIMQKMEQARNIERADYNRKVKDNNGKIENNIMDSLLKHNPVSAEKALSSSRFMDEDGGKPGADLQWEWFSRITTWARDERAGAKANSADDFNQTFQDIATDADNVTIPVEEIIQRSYEAFANHQIDELQERKLLAKVSPRVKERTDAYVEPFKAGASNPSFSPEQQARYKLGITDMQYWASNNLRATDDEFNKAADILMGKVKDKVADLSVRTIFGQMQQAISPAQAQPPMAQTAPIRRPTASELKTMTPVAVPTAPVAPAKSVTLPKGVAVVSSQVRSGVTFYQGGDGKTYKQVGEVWKWWDGKAWQTAQ